MITLYYDIETRQWLTSVGGSQVHSVAMKCRDNVQFSVSFLKSGESITISGDGLLGLKKRGAYTSSYVAFAQGWTSSVVDDSTFYSFNLNLNTQQAIDLFTGSSENDPSARLMLEVEWVNGTDHSRTSTLTAVLENDVNVGGEGTPAVAIDLKASQADAEAGTDNSKWMTPLRVKQSIDENGGGGGNVFDANGDLIMPENGGVVFDRNDTSIRVGMGFHIRSGEGISLEAVDLTDTSNPITKWWYFSPNGSVTLPNGYSGTLALEHYTPFDLGTTGAGMGTGDYNDGPLQKVTITGNLIVGAPLNGVAGAKLVYWITASGNNLTLSFDSPIKIPTDSSFTNPKTLTNGKLYIVQLQYTGSFWMLTSLVGGY